MGDDIDKENIANQPKRSIDDVMKLAEVANVTRTKGAIQTLSYSPDWMKEDYKLLELDKELLSLLHEGDEVIIRGDKDDETVLCSRNKTFELRAADTSNTLLLVPELTSSGGVDDVPGQNVIERHVLSCFSTYYEVRLTQPRLERLRNILDRNAYSNAPDDDEKEKYTTQELLGLIQSSYEELHKGLNSLGALLINGYWRILDINYQEKAFSQILALVEEQSWDWHSIPLKSTCDILEELYPDFVIEYCLEKYGAKVGVDSDADEDAMYSLDEESVSKYYAEYILRPARGKFNFLEFMEAWEQSLPDGMKTDADHLLGVALIDVQSHPAVIWHFAERSLPENPSERFNILFKTRKKWEERDIIPYIKNILSPGQKMSSLFLKYARCSTDQSGGKIYNSKRPQC